MHLNKTVHLFGISSLSQLKTNCITASWLGDHYTQAQTALTMEAMRIKRHFTSCNEQYKCQLCFIRIF